MKQTRIIMGIPITVEIVDEVAPSVFDDVFAYFTSVDERFSTYKPASEISQINAGLPRHEWSDDMRHVLELCARTKRDTYGFFDIQHHGKLDPSGLVKGWAIQGAVDLLRHKGARNFYVEAGGDIQVVGRNAAGERWAVGIRNPFNMHEIIKTVRLTDAGIATSGTYVRGEHIYRPRSEASFAAAQPAVRSLTVIAPTIYDADRYATAAFAMGWDGIAFIASLPGLEAYQIDASKTATFTGGFERYVHATTS